MSFKYKLILLFIIIVITASMPLTLFILEKQEKEKISRIIDENKIISEILARSTLNIILMNGGDVRASKVDCKDMISIVSPLRKIGMVYADAIFLTSDGKSNGTILASIGLNGNSPRRGNRLGKSEIERLLNVKRGFSEITLRGRDGNYLEFVTVGRLNNKKPVCIGRVIFSRSFITKPIKLIRHTVYKVTAAVILLVSILGYMFSMLISKPVDELSRGMRKIEQGQYDYRVYVKSRDEFGELAEMFNKMSDMIKAKIEELEATNIKLKEMDKMKDQFLANTSHELKTPIHGIIGIADSLIDGVAGNLNEDVLNNLSMIMSSGKRLSKLINNILDYSKLKYNMHDINFQPLDIYSVTEFVIALLKRSASEKNITVINDIPRNTPLVYGDEDKIQQILLNIIDNAIKFSHEGKVIIRAEVHKKERNRIIISVLDFGIGIDENKIDLIFDSFQQADGSVSRRFSGSGLGLAIVKELVKLHGGEIAVESQKGKGSDFKFSLPLWDKSAG